MEIIRVVRAIAAGLVVCAAIRAQEAVSVQDTPDTAAPRNAYYHGNREPLLPSPLIKLPIGAVKPQGWLRKQLELQAAGFSGHLTEISSFCNKKNNAWLSKEGVGSNGWEEVPYWFRGFCALGYVLDDARIIAESKEWLEAVIASSREDGYFGPRSNLKEKGDHDMMPNMSMMFALRSYYEYTGDKRVLDILTRYFKWQLAIPDKLFFSGGWQVPRNGDNMDSVYWLYNITGDAFLLELTDKLRRTGTSWMKEPTACHNVDYSMGFRKPAQFYPQNKDISFLKQTEKNYDSIYGIYGQVPGGMFAGDEFARPGFTDPRNAIETCGTVDMMLSQQILLRITGDVKWADRCENAAYNSLPAALTADMKGLRYLTSVNQIVSDHRNRAPELADQGDMQTMNPHSHRCCQHNVAMGWPYFAESLWHATPGNGLAAVFYGASTVRAKVGDGTEVTLTETTPYPFDGNVEIAFDCPKAVEFPLYLRVPGWCAKPEVSVNGQKLAADGRPSSYIRIGRTWAKGDKVALVLPMEVTVQRWEKQKNCASVNRGPLSFSLKIGEDYQRYEPKRFKDPWGAWEILPTTPWNYGLVFDAANPGASFETVMKPWPETNMVFTHEGTPVELRAKAKRIPNWTDISMGLPGKLQPSPVKSSEPVETVTLIPMGAARLRIASFPVIGDGPNAREWQATEPMPASYWPNPQAPSFLRDGRLPTEGVKGVDCFKWVGWAGYALGEKHWVRQDFEQEETVASCEIFWAAQPEPGWLTEPEYWKLFYLDGAEWKEVELQGKYGFEPNRFMRVAFKPVKTRALKIEAQTKKKKSAGIFEWRSWVQAGDQVKHSSLQSFGPDIMGDPAVKTVSSCDVTWHKDPTDPMSQPPKSWKLFARQSEQWKEVANPSGYGLDPEKPNTVKFDPVEASAMRLDVFCDPGVSAGPHEWKIKSEAKK
jgi:hypothetical protein